MKKYIIIILLLFNTIIGMESEDPKKDLWQGFPKKKKKKEEQKSDDTGQLLIKMLHSLNARDDNIRLLGSAQFAISEEEEQLDAKLRQQLIKESPKEIQQIVHVISKRKQDDNLFQVAPFMTNIRVFFGIPGTGKSTLAKAIALQCGLHYTFVSLQLLSNQYQHSTQSHLTSILGTLAKRKDPEVIILDELQTIVKKRNKDDYDMEAAEALWKYLDIFKKKKNFLVIATANDLKNLPEQVKTRIKGGIHEILPPDQNKREKILHYYLTFYLSAYVIPSPSEVSILAKMAKNFTARDLETMVQQTLSYAYQRQIEDDTSETLEPLRNDFEKAIVFVKQDNERFFPWYKKTYQMIKPHIGTTIQTLIPLTLQLGANCIMHAQGMNQTRTLHYSSLNQQAQFHNESIELQKTGLALQEAGLKQQKDFHDETKQLTLENFKHQFVIQITAQSVEALVKLILGNIMNLGSMIPWFDTCWKN